MYSVTSAADSDLYSIYKLVSNKLSATDSSTSAAVTTESTTSGGDSVSLSSSATVLSQLQALKSQDSEKFNSALSEITSKLRKAAASQVKNPSVGLELSKLADKCDTLAKETKLTNPDTTSSTTSTSSDKYSTKTTSLADLLNNTYSSSASSYYNTYSTNSSTDTSPLSQLIASLFGD